MKKKYELTQKGRSLYKEQELQPIIISEEISLFWDLMRERFLKEIDNEVGKNEGKLLDKADKHKPEDLDDKIESFFKEDREEVIEGGVLSLTRN